MFEIGSSKGVIIAQKYSKCSKQNTIVGNYLLDHPRPL